VVEWLILLFRARYRVEVSPRKLDIMIDVFRGFSQSFQANAGIVH
jgi:hypothetical protein